VIKNCEVCNSEFKTKPSHYERRKYCSYDCRNIAQKETLKGKNNPNYKGGKVKKICQNCGKEYKVIPARAKTSVACSVKCNICIQLPKAIIARKKAATYKWRERKTDTYIFPRSMIFGKYCRLYNAKNCGHLSRKGRKYCESCSLPRGKITKTCPVCNKEYESYRKEKRVVCSRDCYGKLVAERQKGEKSHLWKGGLTDKNMLLRKSPEAKEWRKQVFKRDDYTCQHCGERGARLDADHIKPWALYPELRFELSNGRTLCRPCHLKTDTWGHRTSIKVK
jgi:hypothetical protein